MVGVDRILQLVPDSFVVEGQHAAISVVEDHDLVRAEEMLTDDHTPKSVMTMKADEQEMSVGYLRL